MATSNNAAPRRHDAYLEWGLATCFRYFFREQRDQLDGGAIGLLIEWDSVKDGNERLQDFANTHGFTPPARVYFGQKILAISIPVQLVRLFVEEMAPFVKQIELAAPVAGEGKVVIGALNVQSRFGTLFAVFDDGCAFLNVRFMRDAGTRVLWLWNQDEAAVGLPLQSLWGPSRDCDFGYGAQWPRGRLTRMIQEGQGRQEVIYDEAGLTGLQRSAAHGPHVMDLLCGGVESPGDFVFVQFPQAGIEDPSGRWLGRHVLDGLHYVIEAAGPKTTRIVVNISWGPQTGPHDGMSLLERAIDQLVLALAALPEPKELIVTLPAGNSFSARAHAQINYQQGGSLQWIVPPDAHTPAFLEIWWPKDVALEQALLYITPPGGATEVEIRAGMPWTSQDWFVDCSVQGDSAMALVVVHPSEGGDPLWRGRAGQWKIRLEAGAASAGGDVHLYLARADHNMGARRRAKAGYLIDDKLEAARFVAPEQRFDEVTGSAIRRAGTLNGIATGERTWVAAGCRFDDSKCTPYSSAGPTRDNRNGPYAACVTDRSKAIPGVRASGVRSGTTFRLIGTSTAAPQLARKLGLNSVDVPKNPGNESPERIGCGLLPPEPGLIRDV